VLTKVLREWMHREFGDIKGSLSGTVLETWYYDFQESVAQKLDQKYLEGNVITVVDPEAKIPGNQLRLEAEFGKTVRAFRLCEIRVSGHLGA
jgi:hypothetical protein